MRGPDHYLAGEANLRTAEDLYRNGDEHELLAGVVAANIAQAHFAAACAAATAELDGRPTGPEHVATARRDEDALLWQQVLVDDPDPELADAGEDDQDEGGGDNE